MYSVVFFFVYDVGIWQSAGIEKILRIDKVTHKRQYVGNICLIFSIALKIFF